MTHRKNKAKTTHKTNKINKSKRTNKTNRRNRTLIEESKQEQENKQSK